MSIRRSGFWIARRGATAVEFALIASILVGLLLAFIDLGLLMYKDANLQGSTQKAARAVRIARNETPTVQSSRFNDALCSNLVLIDCGEVEFDLRRYDSLASIDNLAEIENGSIVSPQFETVGPADLIFVTVAYRHKMFTPIGFLVSSGIPDTSSEHLMVVSVFTLAES